MKSKQYWVDRAAERMVGYMDEAEKVSADIGKAYQKAMQELNKEAETIFRTFQTQHHLTEAQARLLLKNAKGKTMADKLKDALKHITDEEQQAKIKAAIDAPAYQWRIGRLEALQDDIDSQCRNLYGVEQKAVTGHLKGLYGEAYNRATFDVQKGTGLGFAFHQMPTSRINEILKNPWSGENYSSRIWGHVSDMGDQLKEEMLVSFMTGRSAEKSAMAVAERFGVGASDARRLVRTESNYIANQAEMDSNKECGIEKYEFVATLDIRTSPVCQGLDGKVFPVDKAQAGVNMPPMHPYCRSTTIAVFDDDVTEGLTRRARDPITGKTELVPADMTYPEWKKWIDEKYGAGTVDKHAQKSYNESNDRKQFERYKATLGKNAPKSFDDFQKIKYSDGYGRLKTQYADAKIQERIRNGDINKTIHEGQQGKHILQHNNYIEGRSYLREDVDPQELVNKYAGTGKIKRNNNGKWSNKEVVVADDIIGYDISDLDGSIIPTKSFTIHYSKKGVHIVPKRE